MALWRAATRLVKLPIWSAPGVNITNPLTRSNANRLFLVRPSRVRIAGGIATRLRDRRAMVKVRSLDRALSGTGATVGGKGSGQLQPQLDSLTKRGCTS